MTQSIALLFTITDSMEMAFMLLVSLRTISMAYNIGPITTAVSKTAEEYIFFSGTSLLVHWKERFNLANLIFFFFWQNLLGVQSAKRAEYRVELLKCRVNTLSTFNRVNY